MCPGHACSNLGRPLLICGAKSTRPCVIRWVSVPSKRVFPAPAKVDVGVCELNYEKLKCVDVTLRAFCDARGCGTL